MKITQYESIILYLRNIQYFTLHIFSPLLIQSNISRHILLSILIILQALVQNIILQHIMNHIPYDEKTIEEKLKLMTHYDVDRQYMAASDLSEIIEKHYQKVSAFSIQRIVSSLLNHLNEESTDLHGNAIKCLSKIIAKLPLNQSKRICSIMINNIISPSTNSQVRDIYGTCVKTIINDVGFAFGEHIKDLLKLAIQGLLKKSKDQNITVQQELVDIITSFLKKWPKQVQKIQFSRREFLQYLLTNILTSKQPILRKRSYVCLGVFSSSLNLEQIKLILIDKQLGLLPHYILASDYDFMKIIIHSLLAVLKSGNPNIAEVAAHISSQINKRIIGLEGISDISKSQKIFQLIEASVQCLIQIVKIFPELVEIPQEDENLYKLSNRLIDYSPFGQIMSADGMDIEEDQYEEEISSDSSWKVRKSIIQLIVELSSISQSNFKKYVKISKLYNRFEESQPQVIQTIINGFQQLFNSYTKCVVQSPNEAEVEEIHGLSKRTSSKGFLEELLELLIIHIQKILNNLTLNQNIIVSGAKLMSSIGRLFTTQITNSDILTKHYLQTAFKGLEKAKYNEVKIDLLNFYQFVLRNVKTQIQFQKLFKVFLRSTQSNLYKVSSSAFKALHALLSTGQMIWSDQLGNCILMRLKETDIDQQIRNSVIGCVSEILHRYPSSTPQNFLQQFVSELLNKLNNQIQKRHIISAIWKISLQIKLTPKLIQILNNIISTIAGLCLNISDNVIRIKACEAIHNTLLILSKNTHRQVIDKVMEQTKQILKDRVFPQFLGEIIKISPQATIPYLSKIINLQGLPSYLIKHLVDSGSIKIQNLLSIIEKNLSIDNVKNVINILGSLDIQMKQLENMQQNQIQQQLVIGYLGSKKDPKNFQKFLEIIWNETKDQHIRLQASVALGLSASRNVNKYLPTILGEIVNKKQKYLLLNSLKYLIINSDSTNQTVLLDLQQKLFQNVNGNESILISIAECIGLITDKYLNQSFQIISSKLQSKQQEVRFIAVSSYRYFMNAEQSQNPILSKYIEVLLPLIQDQVILVRSSVIKSLSIIAYYLPSRLSCFLNEKFFQSFYKIIAFDQKLVEIVNYGSSKQKVDKGKTIRLDGFTFLQTLVDKVVLSKSIVNFIITSCLKTLQNDTSLDVLANRTDLLKRLCEINLRYLKDHEDQVTNRLGVSNGKLKQYLQKKDKIDPKIQKIIRTILQIVLKIEKTTLKQEIRSEIQKIRLVPLFMQKIKSIKVQ